MVASISAGEIGALAGGLAALSAAVGGIAAGRIATREFRLKSEAHQVERDVRLSRLFLDLMQTANGRHSSVLSEGASEAIAQALIERGAPWPAIEEALKAAVVNYPVGEATQAAAIATIGSLGVAHPTLRDPAFHALDALRFVEGRNHLTPAREAALRAVEAAR